jgi:hypothetical protein
VFDNQGSISHAAILAKQVPKPTFLTNACVELSGAKVEKQKKCLDGLERSRNGHMQGMSICPHVQLRWWATVAQIEAL